MVKIISYMGFKHIRIIYEGKHFQNSENVRNIIDQLKESIEVFLKLSHTLLNGLINN
jgi:hypothetical protein